MKYLLITICIFIGVFNSIILKAQSNLTISCTILSCNPNMDNLNISCENLVTNEIIKPKEHRNKSNKTANLTQASRSYEIVTLLQSQYRVTLTQPGCLKKLIYIDTSIPTEKEGEYEISFKLELKTQNDSARAKSDSMPISFFNYNSNTGDFNYVKNPALIITSILNRIGVEKTIRNEFANALSYFNEALGLNSNSQEVLFNRGGVKLKLKDIPGACEDWNSAKQNGHPNADELIEQYCN